jgi:flagellin-like hook-associated protein FlgL
MSDITLTSSMRANLVSLQTTSALLGQTQERLSSGLKVNSAVDNPAAYFAARGHNQRAELLSGLKDNISEAIQTIKAADKGVKGVLGTIEALRGVITQARSALNDTVNSGTTLSGLSTQYDELIKQLNNLAGDSAYKGINFLSGTTQTLTVNFNENATTKLTMSGFDASSSGLGISGGVAGINTAGTLTSADLDTSLELDAIETGLNKAIASLQTKSSELAANLTILTTRQSYLTDMINVLRDGSTSLTVADTNEEGANLLMLQTRQQLGTTALSLSSQAAQSVLRLFG